MTTLDPRVHAANQRAAADRIAESTLLLECVEADLNELHHTPASAARLARLFALRFKRSSAERAQAHAIREARRAGLLDGQEYRAEFSGQPFYVFLDGPCVSLFSD